MPTDWRTLFGRACAVFLFVAALAVPAIAGAHDGPIAGTGSLGTRIAAAGDIACDPLDPDFNGGQGVPGSCRQHAVSDLIQSAQPDAVLPLGDNQYYCGGHGAFQQSYDLSWGRFNSIAHPVVGNHEYLTHGGSIFGGTGCDESNLGAAGHYDYFNGVGNFSGAAGDRDKGYYSYDVGSWHLIALNTSCVAIGGCGVLSPQGRWLAADLEAHEDQCTLAYWHIPLFSSGGRSTSGSLPLWNLLYSAGAEVVLTGHDHMYERFAPQRGDGTADPARGIRQFVAGTGGSNLTSVSTLAPNSEVHDDATFGALMLNLNPASYEWNFVPEPGGTFTDSGTGTCHGTEDDASPPDAPNNLTATATSSKNVELSWRATTDDVGVAGYLVYRDGQAVANLGPKTLAYSDKNLTADTRYTYWVRAYDESGKTSSTSNKTFVRTFGIVTSKLVPVADTFVDASRPTLKFGSQTNLRAGITPETISYLRFDLSSVNEVISAKLRVFGTTNGSSSANLRGVADDQWQESAMTYATRPAVGAVAGTAGGKKDEWREYDVTALAQQDELLSVALTGAGDKTSDYASRETGANAPQLIVTAEGDAAQTVTQQFVTTADAYVDSSQPGANFATALLRTDAQPVLTSYLKFNLTNVGTKVKSAKLRVMPVTDSSTGADVRSVVGTTWQENTLTYANRPPVGAVAASSGRAVRNAWQEIDVTSLVRHDGPVSLAMTTTDKKGLDYGNRENPSMAPRLIVTSEGSLDTQRPTTPTLTGTAANPKRVDLSWSASTDNGELGGYTVYRDSAAVALVGPDTLHYSDRDVSPSSTYSYTVGAFDADDNHSDQSNAVSLTTPDVTTRTFTPVADTYVDAATPTVGYGTSSALRTDASPEARSYLRFDLKRLGPSILNAKLRVHATASNALGYDVHGVASNSWDESSTTYETKPDMGETVGSSGPVTAGAWTEVDVTSLVSGNGQLSVALTSMSPGTSLYASRETAVAPELVVTAQVPPPDLVAPSVPALTSAIAVTAMRVDLSWDAASDDDALDGYTVYRDGSPIATVGPNTLSFSDTSASPSSSYSYDVDAFDAAGNHSARSNSIAVDTPGATTHSFTPVADTYVDASNPTASPGISPILRTDVSPDVRSYLRFDVGGIGGRAILNAKLRVYANNSNAIGFDVRTVPDVLWGETTTSYATKPEIGGIVASSGPTTTATWKEVDVTELVTGNGPLSLAMTSTSNANSAFASRESGANAPQLVVTTQVPPPDNVAPSAPALTNAVAPTPQRVDLSWDAASDDVGVDGYTIYRDGSAIATVGPSAVSYSDTSVSPASSYSYELDAFDVAGNHSLRSNAIVAATPAATTQTYTPVADTYVDASIPTSHPGTSPILRTDVSPDVRSYLRFDVGGLAGTNVLSAKLRVYSNNSNAIGFDVRGVTDILWSEATTTYDTKPDVGSVVGSSGPTTGGTWREVDVTSLVTGSGLVSLALTSTSNANATFASRETGATAAQLVVQTF